MRSVIKTVATVLLCFTALAALASCSLREGEVSKEDWEKSVELDGLSSYTQTVLDADGKVKSNYVVRIDVDTLYRIEYGADGKILFELYIQKEDANYYQYRNEYNADGEPQTWKRSKVQREIWVTNRSFLYGIDERYGLQELLKQDDFVFDAEAGIYRCDELPVMYDSVYFTDVAFRFVGNRMSELEMIQNYGNGKVKLQQTFTFDEGDLVIPDSVLNAPR